MLISSISSTFDTMPTFFDSNYGGPTVSGGQLNIPCISAYAGVLTSAVYDLTGTSVYFQLVTDPGVAGTREFFVDLTLDASNKIQLFTSGSTAMTGRLKQAAVNTDTALGAYDPVARAWWRIRESGGTIFWDAAPDGVAWSNLGSHLNVVAVTSLTLGISSGYYGTEAASSAVVDNLNIVPAGSFNSSAMPIMWGS